jgi:hypothetical protein
MCKSTDHMLPQCPLATAARGDRNANRTLANFFALHEVTFEDDTTDEFLEQQSDSPLGDNAPDAANIAANENDNPDTGEPDFR